MRLLLLLLSITYSLFCTELESFDYVSLSTVETDTSNELENAYNNSADSQSAKELTQEKLNNEAAKFIAYWEGATHTERFEKRDFTKGLDDLVNKILTNFAPDVTMDEIYEWTHFENSGTTYEYNEKYRLLTNALGDKIEELYAKELAEAISRYEDSKDPNGRHTSRYWDYGEYIDLVKRKQETWEAYMKASSDERYWGGGSGRVQRASSDKVEKQLMRLNELKVILK